MNQLRDLANRMQAKMKTGKPYVLILGAGASLSSGCSSMWEIVHKIIADHSNKDVTRFSDDQKLEEFYCVLDDLGDDRYSILSDYIKGVAPSIGYRRLAELAKWGYYDIIITTNFDPLLENALSEIRLRREDFTYLVRKIDLEGRLEEVIESPIPRIKILKLHGDLYHNRILFSSQEILDSFEQIESEIRRVLKRGCVIVGNSMKDVDLHRCFIGADGAIWYVNPSEPSVGDPIWQIMGFRKGSKAISGSEGKFDEFFQRLHQELNPQDRKAREEIAQGHYGLAMKFLQNAKRQQDANPSTWSPEKPPDKELLFRTDLRFQADLENGTIPKNLRQKFESEGIHLFLDATVSTREPKKEWSIESRDQTYTAVKNYDELEIYGHPNQSLHLTDEFPGREAFLNSAISALEQAITFGREIVDEYYYWMGHAYEQLGDINKAIYDYSQAIELNKEHPDRYFARGCCYTRLMFSERKCFVKAISDFQYVLRLEPDNPYANSNLNRAWQSYTEAIRNYMLESESRQINKQDYQEEFEVNADEAEQQLTLLCEQNVLIRKGRGRGIYYTQPEEDE